MNSADFARKSGSSRDGLQIEQVFDANVRHKFAIKQATNTFTERNGGAGEPSAVSKSEKIGFCKKKAV